ncbi:Serine/threonine-protein kinase MRCK beta [Coemansia sp. RSA 1285]|nr:Serine/threonine-protein kinase MRCK beta [Coemansia sp. RSA 1285]
MSPGVRTLEERGRQLTDSLFAQDVLAYRGAVDTGAILDALLAVHEELNDRPFLKSPNIIEFIERYKPSVDDVKALRLSKTDFEFIRTLARGQFGIVDIVRSKHNRGIYAMKTLNKQALLSQREQAAFLEERDVLVLGKDSPWIPDLYASFQDKENLYIVMEFVAGGDLFSMLDRCENAVIDEDAARFYAAEILLALEDLHKIGYIHRDCKPQNTLLDERGHVKLADFGSCARIDASGAHEAKTSVPVGTCDYIAPETLRARELGNGGVVSSSCDWWSLGAVLYEMVYGDPPFYSDSVPETYAKIMACEKHLAFDETVDVSDDAKDLMRKLLTRQESRIGLSEIKTHPFFAGVDWSNIRNVEAPFVPRLSSPDDTSNFSVGDEAEEDIGMAVARASSSRLGHGKEYAGEQLPFIGFTYLPPAFQVASRRAGAASVTPRGPRDDPLQVRALKTRIEQLESMAGAKEVSWAAQKRDWEMEKRRFEAERTDMASKISALEAQVLSLPEPAAVPAAPVHDSAMQTEELALETEKTREITKESKALSRDGDANATDVAELSQVMTEAYHQLTSQLVGSLEQQFGNQTEQLGKLITTVNEIASTNTERMDESLQKQLQAYKRELTTLTQAAQTVAPVPHSAAATVVASPSVNATNSPRLSSVSSLAQAYQAMGGSSARLSLGSMQSIRNQRRSISAVDDASVLDSQPTAVVATLVNEMSRNGSAGDAGAGNMLSGSPGSLTPSRKSLGPIPTTTSANSSPMATRVARAERRVSSGFASDTLSVIGSKCDRMAALFENYAGEIEKIKESQTSLIELCCAMQEAMIESKAGNADGIADDTIHDASAGSYRGRRKTEQMRRRGGGLELFGSVNSSSNNKGSTRSIDGGSKAEADMKAFELYKTAADELVASLRAQLDTSENARTAAEGRATELLGWIGRESKGRALLEDMIRTAQQACKMAEEKLDAMIKETSRQKEDLESKDEEIGRLQQTIDTRDKELRHLRRASRKALDQLADIKSAQEQQPQPQVPSRSDSVMDASRQFGLEAELQEAAGVHVRLQFEIARLEGEISRLEDEKTQLARDLGRRDKRILELEKRVRSASEEAASDGIRVRAMDDGADIEDEAGKKFGSIGTKSHKRFKVQLQNMQKHIEYLETKLALAVSENDVLKKNQQKGDDPKPKPKPRSKPAASSTSNDANSKTSANSNTGSSQQQQPQTQGHGMRFPGFSRNSSNNSVGSRSTNSGKARASSSMFPNLPSNLDTLAASTTSLNDRPMSPDNPGGANSHADGANGSAGGSRPRNDSLTASFERIRSPFKGFRRHFT